MTKNKFEKFQYSVVIRESHLDTFGHVNNATYLQLFEEARWEFITSRGFGLKEIHQTGLGPVILECHLKFAKELRLREKIVIESETLQYNKKVGSLRQDIFNEAGQICCKAVMEFGLFDTKTRKLIQATPQWLQAIGAT